MHTIICRPVQSEAELRQSFAIRHKVFVEEQGLFKRTDRDRKDKQAMHIVAVHHDTVIGTVRVFQKQPGIWHGSRLAVVKGFRGRVGKLLIQKAVETVTQHNARRFCAAILLRNVPLFKRLGWKEIGSIISYRGQPHQMMEASLE